MVLVDCSCRLCMASTTESILTMGLFSGSNSSRASLLLHDILRCRMQGFGLSLQNGRWINLMSPLLPVHRCLRLVLFIPRRSSSPMHPSFLSLALFRRQCTAMFLLTAGSSGRLRSSNSQDRGNSHRKCSSPSMMLTNMLRGAKRQIKGSKLSLIHI